MTAAHDAHPGVTRRALLPDREAQIMTVAWSCDGRRLATAGRRSNDVWAMAPAGGPPEHAFTLADSAAATSRNVVWSPVDPDLLAQAYGNKMSVERIAGGKPVSLWTAPYGDLGIRHAIDFAPTGETVATIDTDGRSVRLLRADDGTQLHRHRLPIEARKLWWSPDGEQIFCHDESGTSLLLAPGTGETRRLDHDGVVNWAAWSPDGHWLATANSDGTIRIRDRDGRLGTVLEGHTDSAKAVEFWHDGRLLFSMAGKSMRCWRVGTWECLADIPLTDRAHFVGGLALAPGSHLLARRVDERRVDEPGVDLMSIGSEFVEPGIELLSIDPDRMTAAASPVRTYANAKVVLLGDTGVGKSGLGLVLSKQAYRATDSTHARQVFLFDEREVELPAGTEKREILLWDLAGQPGYRLIHQLHLAEASVALIVFDARSEGDPFSGVRYWARALRQHAAARPDRNPPVAILVAARTDRGGIPASPERIRSLCADLGLGGFFETSAKQGLRIAELADAVRAAVDWSALPRSISTGLFETIKRFLVEEKDGDRVLASGDDLFRDFQRRHPDLGGDDLRGGFDTCVRLLEGRDLLRRLSFGGYVLLRPELLDAYASALIDTARGQPDGLGYIAETDALAGRFAIPDDTRLTGQGEELLLIATVEEMLRHDLALREITEGGVDLVFPSQFTVEREAPADTTADVVFRFEGSVPNAYATLAVRLSHVNAYQRDEMWRNAGTYRAKVGGVCGLRVRETEEGRGELTVFFDAAASEETRFTFEDYVHAHLAARALPGSVRRERLFTCPRCGYRLDAELVRRKLERGATVLTCPDCEQERILLLDREERLGPDSYREVQQMNASADAGRDLAAATATIRGKEVAQDYDVFLSYNSADRAAVAGIAEGLRTHGLLPWLDTRALVGGQAWQDELVAQIRGVRAAAVFLGPHGLGRWQKVEADAIVDQQIRRPDLKVIPVLLPGTPAGADLPGFLGRWHAVDFREAWPSPFERLLRAITE